MLYICTAFLQNDGSAMNMKEKTKAAAREFLTTYMEEHGLRKTPERFAVLDVAYSFTRPFSLNELGEAMIQRDFVVSRGTLYNTMQLFVKSRLIACYRLSNGARYEPLFNNKNHCRQVCVQCGSVQDLNAAPIARAVEKLDFKRFRQDSFALYVYGLCSSCRAKNSREEKKQQNKTWKRKQAK